MKQPLLLSVLMTLALAIVTGCEKPRDAKAESAGAAEQQATSPSNRIDVPATVRQNLGITFAKVERRRVASTIRVPGQFELLPSARREYRAIFAGWVRLTVAQYDAVDKGSPIFQLDSPDWHRLRKELHENQSAIATATAQLAVAEGTKAEAQTAVRTLEQRITELAGAQVRRAELESELITRRASIARLEAEVEVNRAALNEANHDFALEIETAASLLGVTPQFLTETIPNGSDPHHDGEHKVQRWFSISKITRPATGPGIVESIHVADGAWVEAGALVATTVDPTAIRFRATGLQSDLGRLKDGLSVAIVPPQGSGIGFTDVLPGKLKVGLVGDAGQRTIELMTTPEKLSEWARPGVSALMEIVIEDSGGEEAAIPLSAVVKDELTHIFYRRDPTNPDKVIRVEADLGVSDGKWVVVKSGVKAGDEVVLEGAYELKLAGGGKAAGGGHFHADGTWHAEPDK